MSSTNRTESPRGQTLVIVAVAMVALVGMVGVVIDIGLQWADNRGSQNGSDATAQAGAIVLMEYMLDASSSVQDADPDVLDAVESAAATNRIEIEIAEYTDWQGNLLGAEVGAGTTPANAQGVRVVGTRVHTTFFARVVGVDELSVFTEAIAVTGPSDPDLGAFLPVTVPTTVVTCDGQNKSVATEDGWEPYVHYVIPLCGNNPGSVGWIDWTPPHGGDSELAGEICDPDPPPIVLPDWFYVTSTGNTNSGPVQSCFEKYIDQDIMIPLFEDTCRIDPGDSAVCTDPAPIGGVNQWYYFPRAASLHLTGVYIQGVNDICDEGNGATSCITGYFIDTAIVGEVTGPWDPSDTSLSRFFTVQLIR
jgi:hypothetical protein